LKIFLQLRNECRTELPERFRHDDVRYAEALVEQFLSEYTRPGDRVLDPFAGFGTTLLVAEAMGRVPLGIEYDVAKVEDVRPRLQNPQALLHGDARQLASYLLPPCDFSITSPPYMRENDELDPLTAYTTPVGSYQQYLSGVGQIYRQVAGLMKPGARVVIEAANLKGPPLTLLAWDIAGEVSRVLSFEGEIVVGWEETYGYGYDHSYCLVFRKRS